MSENLRKKETRLLTLDDLSLLLTVEKGGRPNYGAILHYFRVLMGWTAERLAFLYSEALGLDEKESITPHWIYMMEKQNQVPVNEKRRWILARLLGIPPVLFGLETRDFMPGLFSWEDVDVHEYRLALEHYCRGWHTGSIFQAVGDIKRRVSNLHNKAPYSSEKKEIRELLCGYFLLLADLAHHYLDFNAAIEHLNNTILIAEQEQFYDIWVFALRQRGGAYKERGEILAGLKGYAEAKSDFEQAALSFQEAQQLAPKAQTIFRGLVALSAGTAFAFMARDDGELTKALDTIDTGSREIGKQGDTLSLPIIALLDEEKLSLDRAFSYLAYPSSNAYHAANAQRELENTANKSIKSLARNALKTTLLAKSYLIAGKYEMAVAYAEIALEAVQARGSRVNLARLEIIYQHLKNDPSYGKSSDVALLGTKLLKAQKPELFQ